jgi:hypothetical protein
MGGYINSLSLPLLLFFTLLFGIARGFVLKILLLSTYVGGFCSEQSGLKTMRLSFLLCLVRWFGESGV